MAPHKLNPEDWACIEDVNVLCLVDPGVHPWIKTRKS